jgi:tRNA A-37 threonylcarbamoyl transferase component Bud32
VDLSPAESDTLDLLDAYVAELHAGRRPDRGRWLRDHPHLAAHLDCLDQLDQLAAPDPDSTLALPPGPGPSLVGKTLADGKYELLAEVGRGGMGVVYKARQVELDRVVALKMVLAGSMASGEQLARFQAEARVAARVQHPHVIPVFESGQVNGLPYLVMQYVEGCSLADKLRKGPLDTEAGVRIVAAVARAVADLHEHGIVHRDLKPSNILLDANDQPFVTDFGLAKLVEGDGGVTQTGMILGTPQYMAPEQALGRGKEAGPPADVYSLGAILYECLTGRPAFRAATPFETVLAVLENDPLRPRQVNPKVPRVLEQVVLQCLEKDPARRFPSAAALADLLEQYLKGELVTVRRPGPVIAFRRWVRRQPGLAARLIAFAIFAAIVVFNHVTAPELRPYTLPVLSLLATWAAVSWVCQRLLWGSESGYWWAYVWSAADIILLTAVQLVTQSGVSPLIIGYPFLIAGASLWTRRRMVWVTTACAVVGYSGLMVFDRCWSTDPQPVHRHWIFLVSLVVLGFLMAYQVERVYALSRYYEGKSRD